MNLIETYREEGPGYHPFLIREGWQVAQLNADDNQKIENIKKLDVHFQTDEAFVLLRGEVVLITATIDDMKPIQFHVEKMNAGVTYNVPQDVWHNIAMKEGAEVIIVEKANTHEGDFAFYDLSEEQILEMNTVVKNAFL